MQYVCSQIWLNHLMDDHHHFSHITNLGRKKSPAYKGGLGSGRSKICMHEAKSVWERVLVQGSSFDVCKRLMSAGGWIDGLLPSDTQCAECRILCRQVAWKLALETLPRKICPASFVKSISRLSAVWGWRHWQQK